MWSSSGEQIDRRAFEQLVEEYADRIYNVALRIIGSPEEAEDATQDALLSAYQHRQAFRGEAAISTWLYRIAVNAALQRARRRHPLERLEMTDRADEPREIVDWSEDLSRRVEHAELITVIERGLTGLPEEMRAAVVLRDVEGLSTAEAAEILELSEAALKSRLHRGRVLLRQYLAAYLEGR